MGQSELSPSCWNALRARTTAKFISTRIASRIFLSIIPEVFSLPEPKASSGTKSPLSPDRIWCDLFFGFI